jgi:hypothetical protein
MKAGNVAFVYLDYKNQKEQTIDNVLGLLLNQLVSQSNASIPPLLQLYRRFLAGRDRLVAADLVEGLGLVSTFLPCTFLVLDALDEFYDDQCLELLKAIEQVILKGKSVKLFATSRPHPRGVEEFFSDALTITMKADKLDLSNYITKKTAVKVSNERLRETIVETLSESAQGV